MSRHRTRDAACVAFLQWAAPRLGLRWRGFRKVRGQVEKRLRRRAIELGLGDLDAYRAFIETHPAEWTRVEEACRVTISRFYRDRGVFDALGAHVLPALARRAQARGAAKIRVWSAGCASGEEPYSVALVWHFRLAPEFPDLGLDLLATDARPYLLERARRARYPAASLRELPDAWREAAFRTPKGESELELDTRFRRGVAFGQHDLRRELPGGPFDLVLCRNLVFTYHAEEGQRAFLEALRPRLLDGAGLVVGCHESLPKATSRFEPWLGCRHVYQLKPNRAPSR